MIRELIKLDLPNFIGSPDSPRTADAIYDGNEHTFTPDTLVDTSINFNDEGVLAGDCVFIWEEINRVEMLVKVSSVSTDGHTLTLNDFTGSFLSRRYYIVKGIVDPLSLSFSGKNLPSKIKRIIISGSFDDQVGNNVTLSVKINNISIDNLSVVDLDCAATNTVEITIQQGYWPMYLYQVFIESTLGIYHY
jgi:hypothetical protein